MGDAQRPAESGQEDPAEAKICDHHYACHIRGGEPLSIQICTLCGEVDWADIREQLEGRLIPEGSKVREHWGARWRDPAGYTVGSVYGLGSADAAAMETRPQPSGSTRELMRSLEISTPYQPWTPAVPAGEDSTE